jgi:superfamily I DNA/RNA helicase
MTMASVKGLEAQNIIIHSFGKFLANNSKQKDVFYRQIYVLLTRAQEKVILSISNEAELLSNPETEKILNVLKEYQQKTEHITFTNSQNIKLAKIKPILKEVKDGAELIVTSAELFRIIAGLFAF